LESWKISVLIKLFSSSKFSEWLLEWLHEQPYTKKSHRLALETTYDKTEEGDSKPRLIFFPSIGNHLLTYKGRYCYSLSLLIEASIISILLIIPRIVSLKKRKRVSQNEFRLIKPLEVFISNETNNSS
jgi:hypothetical protein